MVFLGNELANAFGGFCGGGGTRLGGIDNGREMEVLVALEAS
jgi:hypothetical protein